MEKVTAYLTASTVDKSEVKAWEEIVMLPTYSIGEEEKNPVFLEKRVYQGSSGSVYPYPVIEKISDEKIDRPYRALFIENEYIKLMILPELGGRVHMAYDKVKGRHFVYYNQVIKPALVGLTGPWISGGIEFNWPQHHRPSTFLPTDYSIEEFADGSKTIWCSEVERMFRTKGMAGFTLYPGKAYLEIKAKVYNRTAQAQTFLWWANPAVVVNDGYFSVFPPDVNAVFDHGKRDVSTFPIATGTYYKYDYSAGVDISRYKNIPVPTSYMAVNSNYDFVGGYEEDIEAGLLHVASHHVSTGKKQWTWGCGDFGKAWDRNLTDEDGPYIELMTGIYCDNQPDFTWLQPYEEKTWKQYFLPYQAVGRVKNATRDALVNVEAVDADHVSLRAYTTAQHDAARLVFALGDEVLLDEVIAISPAQPYCQRLVCREDQLERASVSLFDAQNRLLVSYKAELPEERPIPDPAVAALKPEDIESMEELFLTGHHIEQYRHATYLATDYYEEALRRDARDIRCNNAMGLLLTRRGQFAKAQSYLQQAVNTQTARNPNPYDGEAYYNLAFSEKMQGLVDDAYKHFYKATWNAAWQDAAYMNLAQIDCMRGDYEVALEHIDRSMLKNWHNHKARQLKCAILRKLKRYQDSEKLVGESLELDLFNIGCRFESYLLLQEQGSTDAALQQKQALQDIIKTSVHSYLEYAIDCIQAGLYSEALTLLGFLVEEKAEQYPMVYYARAYCQTQLGEHDAALASLQVAEQQCPNYCFPNKLEELSFLQNAMRCNPAGARAYYYLGNFWYAARQYAEAIDMWEQSVARDAQFPTVYRNLALAYYNKQQDKQKACSFLEKAFELDPSDSRIFMELDQLHKKMMYPHEQRLAQLLEYAHLVEARDDMAIELATLYNQTGSYQKAYDLIAQRQFHPWEGGEGKVSGQYNICRIALAKEALKQGAAQEALSLLKELQSYPENLGEGKLTTTQQNDVDYHLGVAYEQLGDEAMAEAHYRLASNGPSTPSIAYYYNDSQPDQIYYQALAWRKLGQESKAHERFVALIDHGHEHMDDHVHIDYFAVSLPDLLIWEDNLQDRNKLHCHFVIALGRLGLGEMPAAIAHLKEVAQIDINHQAAAQLLKEME